MNHLAEKPWDAVGKWTIRRSSKESHCGLEFLEWAWHGKWALNVNWWSIALAHIRWRFWIYKVTLLYLYVALDNFALMKSECRVCTRRHFAPLRLPKTLKPLNSPFVFSLQRYFTLCQSSLVLCTVYFFLLTLINLSICFIPFCETYQLQNSDIIAAVLFFRMEISQVLSKAFVGHSCIRKKCRQS